MPKILGILQPKEELVLNAIRSSYYHFNERLSERYGFSISFEEYELLCRIPICKGKPKTQNRKTGFININGTTVLVVKEIKGHRRLITALPIQKSIKK